MKLQNLSLSLVALCAVAILATDVSARRISTFDAGGADAELRESQPTTARGTGSEIASRISGAGNRNSVIYLKFGVGSITPGELGRDITVRTTYRNTNINPGRIQVPNVSNGATTGFDYFVLDPTLPSANWDEATITPASAATDGIGYSLDGDFFTKPTGTPGTPTSGLTYLGSNAFDPADLGPGGTMLVGDNFDLTALPPNSALHQAIAVAQGTPHQTVTIVMGISHPADSPNSGWLNFNYLFNPKEQTTLNNDANSPWGGADNSMGQFAPSLVTTIPEPASFVLLGVAGLALVGMRKRS